MAYINETRISINQTLTHKQMKLIPLTQGKFAQVDDEDYEYLNQFKWCANKLRSTYYARRSVTINGKEQAIMMHRLIMNAKKGEFVDHRFGDGLDNQKINLRICTPSQNCCNSVSRKNSRSKYLGVSYNYGKYIVAAINDNYKTIRIGTFKTEEEAAEAYNKKAIELHGEFAKLNIIL